MHCSKLHFLYGCRRVKPLPLAPQIALRELRPLSVASLSLTRTLSLFLSLFYVAGHERFFNEKISSSIFVAAVVVVVVVDATFDVFRCEKKSCCRKNRVSKREEEEEEIERQKQKTKQTSSDEEEEVASRSL